MNEKRNEENTSAKASPSSISEVYKHNNTGKTKPSTNKGTKGRGRLRNFATVVYPESAPENWLDRLDGLHVPAFVSPLHNQPRWKPKETALAYFNYVCRSENKGASARSH